MKDQNILDNLVKLDCLLDKIELLPNSDQNMLNEYEKELQELCSKIFSNTRSTEPDIQDYIIKNNVEDSPDIVASCITKEELTEDLDVYSS